MAKSLYLAARFGAYRIPRDRVLSEIFPKISAARLIQADRELREYDGALAVNSKSRDSAFFVVDISGRPTIFLPRSAGDNVLAHEMTHFGDWARVRQHHRSKGLSEVRAGVVAYVTFLIPKNHRKFEINAMLTELSEFPEMRPRVFPHLIVDILYPYWRELNLATTKRERVDTIDEILRSALMLRRIYVQVSAEHLRRQGELATELMGEIEAIQNFPSITDMVFQIYREHPPTDWVLNSAALKKLFHEREKLKHASYSLLVDFTKR